MLLQSTSLSSFLLFSSYFYIAHVRTFHSGAEPLTQLSAELGHAFKCETSTPFNLTAIDSTVHLSLIDIEFQPFGMHGGQLSQKGKEMILTFSLR